MLGTAEKINAGFDAPGLTPRVTVVTSRRDHVYGRIRDAALT
jgi:hypothetical protein